MFELEQHEVVDIAKISKHSCHRNTFVRVRTMVIRCPACPTMFYGHCRPLDILPQDVSPP